MEKHQTQKGRQTCNGERRGISIRASRKTPHPTNYQHKTKESFEERRNKDMNQPASIRKWKEKKYR